jgi:hypothetical protein
MMQDTPSNADSEKTPPVEGFETIGDAAAEVVARIAERRSQG